MELKPGYKQTEVGVIPEDWDVVKLGSLGSIQRGASPRPIDSPIWFDNQSNTGWLRISDVTRACKYLTDTTQNLSSLGILNSRLVEKENLVMSICATVGRPIITKKDVCIHDGFVVFNNLKINKEYLYYVLTDIEKNWSKHGQTGSQMNLNTGLINLTSIPLPPTQDEQTAIANALSDADALIQSLTSLIAKKRQIKQGVMQTLLNPYDNGRLKEGWVEKEFGELCAIFTKQTGFDYSNHIKPKLITRYENGAIPFIQNKDFRGKNINFDTDYFIPKNVAKKFPKILLDEKCLLISISGSIGNIGLFLNLREAFLGGAIAVAKFYDKSKLDWVMYYLLSNIGQEKLLKNVKAGSHQNLILNDINKLTIHFPVSSIQFVMVEFFSCIDTEITALETKLEKYRHIKQGMMQNLLTGRTRLVKPESKAGALA